MKKWRTINSGGKTKPKYSCRLKNYRCEVRPLEKYLPAKHVCGEHKFYDWECWCYIHEDYQWFFFDGTEEHEKGFILSMRSILPVCVNISQNVSAGYCILKKDVCDIPTIWTEIRNFMDTRGANLNEHSSRRVIMTLASGLYEESEAIDAAFEMAQLVLSNACRIMSDLRRSEPPAAHAPPQNQDQSSGQYFIDCKSHDVGMRLKQSNKKFSG